MGRQTKLSKEENFAYIAGFLDGDGSLMVQFKKRNDSKKLRIMFTICLYQDSRHDKPLYWIQKRFKVGYISKRNDNITELRINGYKSVGKILKILQRYIRFKHKQVSLILKAIEILENTKYSRDTLLKVAKISDEIAKENYFSSQRKYTYDYVKKILDN